MSSRSDNNGGLATNVWADLLKRHDPSLPRLLQEPEAEEGVSREKFPNNFHPSSLKKGAMCPLRLANVQRRVFTKKATR